MAAAATGPHETVLKIPGAKEAFKEAARLIETGREKIEGTAYKYDAIPDGPFLILCRVATEESERQFHTYIVFAVGHERTHRRHQRRPSTNG